MTTALPPFLAVAALLTLAVIPVTVQAEPHLEVTIKGIEIGKGTLVLGVFDSEENFTVEPLPQSRQIPVSQKGEISATVTGLVEGTYAFVVFQDLNGNNRLDLGKWGIPAEPFAFSRMPMISLGPPSYNSSKFMLSDSGKAMAVKLRHWKG